MNAVTRLNAFWFIVAALLCVGFGFANNGPLIYFDTGAHLADWKAIKGLLFSGESSAAQSAAAVIPPDNTVNGSRPPVYGIVTGLTGDLIGYSSAFAPQIIALLLTLWLVVRVLDRRDGYPGRTVAILVFAGCLGSLPFVAVSLMPDLYAPILILNLALIINSRWHMFVWERVLCALIAIAAVTTHLSHIGIAGAFLIVTCVIAITGLGIVRWRTILLVALVLGAGVGERLAFKALAEARESGAAQQLEVRYPPFLTARMIIDGPGEAYLQRNCTQTDLPECALLPLLRDTARRDATNIVYGTGASGSYRELSQDLQQRISAHQVRFALSVLADDPLGVVSIAAHNFFRQILHVSVWMSFPNEAVYEHAMRIAGGLPAELTATRFQSRPDWLTSLNAPHYAVYLLSLAAIIVMLIPAHREVRGFALLLLVGCLINAAVCGAASQPAPRYGARVVFLLPMAATLMFMLRHRTRL